MRWLENGLIDALRVLGFETVRRDTPPGASSLVGVWTHEHHKVASIGMRIRQGVTSHGFALNVDPDMTAFDRFTVCGLHEVTMTSLGRIADQHEMVMPNDERQLRSLECVKCRHGRVASRSDVACKSGRPPIS